MSYRGIAGLSLFLLITGVVGAGGVSLGAPGVSAEERLTITEEWSICLTPPPHPALTRAAEDLHRFLLDRHRLNLKITQETNDPCIVLSVTETSEKDGFTIEAESAHRLKIEGASPRAVYQGVFSLQDYLEKSPGLPGSFKRSVLFPFQDRYVLWDVLLTGQNKGAIGFDLEQHVREAVRLGYTGLECNRFIGMELLQQGDPRDPYPWYTYWGPSMDQFVSSPLFEGVFPQEYLDRNLADLKHVVQIVKSFGLKPIFMGYEPRYVPESFLQKHPKLRGPRVSHPLRSIADRYSLCVDRPEVLEHYRTLAANLAREVPDLKEMWSIFHDSGAGLCWAHELYSGRNGPEWCREIPPGERMKKFFMSIKEGLREGGLDIPFVVQPHPMSRPEVDAFFATVPSEVELTSGNWASWSPTHRDPLGADLYVLSRLRESGRRTLYYQQHFFGFNVAPTSEFPLVYYLADRLKRAQGLGLDNLNTLGGFVSPPIKKRSAMQEVYRMFLLNPELDEQELVTRVAYDLGGSNGGELLLETWKQIHSAFEKNHRDVGFGLGTEYTSRRTLIRPLVPEISGLGSKERDWWLDYSFAGHLRFGHAHLFRGEGGRLSQDWYQTNRDRSVRARDVFRQGSSRLRGFLKEQPEAVSSHPYLVSHERQLRFLSYVYATGANLYEGQRILDKYSKKGIEDDLKSEVDSATSRFQTIVEDEIANTQAFIDFVEEGGDIGMVLLPEETTWGFSTNLPDLLRRKIEVMRRYLPETNEVLNRWFNSEY